MALNTKHTLTPNTSYNDRRCSSVFGQNVKRMRQQAHINKKTFSLMIGIGRPFLDKIESGEADPRLSIIVRIADALETTPEELLVEQQIKTATNSSSYSFRQTF